MVTLKEYEAYLKVKRFIDGHDEAEIISKLSNERNYTPMIIDWKVSAQPNIIQHQQLLNIVG